MFEPGIAKPPVERGAPRYFAVQDGELLVSRDTETGEASFPAEPPPGAQHRLGSLDGQACVAVDVRRATAVPGWRRVGLRELYGTVSEIDWSLASRAVQIIAWDHDHRYCGRCATPTEPQPSERARRCPRCGLVAYPRLSPAVIVLVTRGEHDQQALLAWGRRRSTPFYSLLAGFVEVGENLEDAVRREVREETGVELAEVNYFGSQPWPFPGQLMVGFRARYASGAIVPEPSEIVEARWFSAEEVESAPVPRGRFSIAGWLIDTWLAEQSQQL